MSDSSVMLAIPAYNCAPQIGRVLAAIPATALDRLTKVVVIDNGSSDGTARAALSAGARLGEKFEVWRNVENYNLGGTHKVAFEHAITEGIDSVVILHGDDQADGSEVATLLDHADRHPRAAAVLGSRFTRGSRLLGYSVVRRVGNRGINLVFSLVSGRRTTDLGSGLNLFRMMPLRDRAYLQFDDKITFNIDLLLHYYERRLSLTTVPISWSETDQVSNARNFMVGRTALEKLMAWRFGRVSRSIPRREYRFEVVS